MAAAIRDSWRQRATAGGCSLAYLTKLLPPTLEEFEAFLRDIDEWYWVPEVEGAENYQQAAAAHVCAHPYAIFQGPRQRFGKSWLMSRYAACCLSRGMSVLVSYPTQGQGEQIMIDRIDQIMLAHEKRFNMLRKKPDNVRQKRWETPYGLVILKILSLSEGAKSGTQGFTGEIWLCDEAQECTVTAYEAVEPAIDIAMSEERGKIVLLGIGGNTTEHLIEAKKPVDDKFWLDEHEKRALADDEDNEETDTLFVARRFTVDDVLRAKPSLTKFYRRKQKSTTKESWEQNYLCLPVMSGTGYIFPILEAEVKPASSSSPHWFEFGIDVGRTANSTIVAVMRCQGEVANCIEILRVPPVNFGQQALMVAEFIRRYPYQQENVRIERNTIGWGLYDSLMQQPGFSQITPVTTTDAAPDFEKSTWILRMQEEAIGYHPEPALQRPRLGVRDPAARAHLKRLMYESKNTPQGVKHDWDLAGHSDLLAALWVWMSERQAGAFAG